MSASTSTKTKPHVLIAGAGIGGLTLAQCLRAADHPFTIFERDTSPTSRSQGWAIALHTILADLVEAVPKDMPSIDLVSHHVPLKEVRPQLCFYDARGSELRKKPMKFMVESEPADQVGYGKGRVIRANRDRLREWLSTNIDVQWGKQVDSFEQDQDGVTVHLTNGTTIRGDILVGAEGNKSAVRNGIIPDAPLADVPACFLTGEVTLNKTEYERMMKLSTSAYAVFGDDYHLFVGLNRIADDASSAQYYWDLIWFDVEHKIGERWIDSASSQELYDYSLSRTAELEPSLTEIIRLTDPQNMKTPPLVLRDLILEDMPITRVTLLGDAAHAMVPFKGEGGCHAIDDAIKLSKVLTEGGDLGEYQKEMLQRGSDAVKASRAAGNEEGGMQTGARMAWGQPARMVVAKG